MKTIRVWLIDEHATAMASPRVALQREAGIVLVDNPDLINHPMGQSQKSAADVAVLGLSERGREGAEIVQKLSENDPEIKIVVLLAEQPAAETMFMLLYAGAHGLLLARNAESKLADAVRAVHGGGTFVNNDIAGIMIPHYLNRRGGRPVLGPLERLSNREREVLGLIVAGKQSAEIARQLAISPKSVTTYRTRLMSKLGIKDVSALVNFAIQHELVALDTQ